MPEDTKTDDPEQDDRGDLPTSFMNKVKELEDEHGELKGWLLNVTQEAGKQNGSDEPLMKVSTVDWPEDADSEFKRQLYVQKQMDREQRVLGDSSSWLMLAGVDNMVRDRDAFFESPEWSSFVGMKQEFAGLEKQRRESEPIPLYEASALDPLIQEVKSANGGRWSKDGLIRFLKEARGHVGQYEDADGQEIQNLEGMTGYRVKSDMTDKYGLKAIMITGTPSSTVPGVEPLPMLMDRITQLQKRNPDFLNALPQMTMGERAYTFREETDISDNVGYTDEVANRVDTARQSDLTIQSFTKSMLRGISYVSATYEQLEYEMSARRLLENQLGGAVNRWLDRETMMGSGAVHADADASSQALAARGLEFSTNINRVISLHRMAPASGTAGQWTANSSRTARGNGYQKAAAETDLRAIRHGLAHMRAEDYGMSMPTHLIMTPYAYEDLTGAFFGENSLRFSGDTQSVPNDQRWLFPSVGMDGGWQIRPFGVPVLQAQNPAWDDPIGTDGGDTAAGHGDRGDVKQVALAHNEVFIVDMMHMMFRSHANGMTVEVDRHPRRSVEEIVCHFGFQLDIWRRLAVHRISGLSFSAPTNAVLDPPGEED